MINLFEMILQDEREARNEIAEQNDLAEILELKIHMHGGYNIELIAESIGGDNEEVYDAFIKWCMRPAHKSTNENFFKLDHRDGVILVKKSSIQSVEFRRKPKPNFGD